MSLKAFISYSHLDEPYRRLLEKSLVVLTRNGLIETWHDRMISPGQNWSKEIDSNLEDSNLILFLVSQDFIASEYCVEIEMKKAIQQHNDGVSIVVPIVIRACDFSGLEISKFQALPTDSRPVNNWSDIDEAWLDVSNGIKKLTTTYSMVKPIVANQSASCNKKYILNRDFYSWLDNTEVKFQHRLKDEVCLSDIFVYPDLRFHSEDINLVDSTLNSKILVNQKGCHCIIGDEQQGKTSLSKRLFLDYYAKESIPVLINGKRIKTSKYPEVLNSILKNQYEIESSNEILTEARRIIIVDDFDRISLNRNHQTKLIQTLKENFDSVILIASSVFRFEMHDIDYLKGFKVYDLLPFGNVKRAEIIEKWVSLGQEETIDEKILYEEADRIQLHIDSFVKKNIVPAKPVFILSILQVLETFTPNNIDLTSYGYCYQYLIYTFLNKINIGANEIDKYVNYLTELAFFLFQRKTAILAIEGLNSFRTEYSSKYIAVNHQVIMSNLIECRIMQQTKDGVSFNYKYIYYFYVAKYIADHISSSAEIKSVFAKLVKHLHKEDNANIIIFVTHHTKDSFVLDEVQLCMMEVFENEIEATLSNNEMLFLQDFILSIPKLIIEQKDVKAERRKSQERKDKIALLEDNEDLPKESNQIEELANINKTLKSIEIIGQILRNRHSSLSKQKLTEIAENAYSIGLRLLAHFLKISKDSQAEIVATLKKILESDESVSEAELEKDIRKTVLFLTYGAIYSVLRKIALSIGSAEAKEIYESIKNQKKTPAVSLVNASIDLLFSKRINVDDLKALYKDLEKNIVAQRMLKESVIQHLYMYPVPSKQKHQLAELFDMPIKSILYLGSQKNARV